MKKFLTASALFLLSISLFAQKSVLQRINRETPAASALEPFRFLAADELMGRSSTRSEIHIAARYIAEQFRKSGLKEVRGSKDFFQFFEFPVKLVPSSGILAVEQKKYELPSAILQFSGKDLELSSEIIYAGYGSEKDLNQANVAGKIVLTELGNIEAKGIEAFAAIQNKLELLKSKGAVALVERFKNYGFPWEGIQQYLLSEHSAYFEAESSDFPVFIVNDVDSSLRNLLVNKSLPAKLMVSGNGTRKVPARNVMGWVEGSDPNLKNEYLLLSAHYDHIGIEKNPKEVDGNTDSIFNGARDNAIGTTAVINAARYFSKHPPRRSVLFICYTAEELGLVGSHYFADHPLVPLEKIVYNLNIDNASYNDTTIVSVIGLGRTSADELLKKACQAYGLKAMPDPAPEQNLFDRSDNVSLAAVGVPAPTFSLGIKKFDDEIEKHYHNVRDEVGDFNLSYGMKYIRAFILASQFIADDPAKPSWIKGDKYEAAWKKLYGKE